MHSGGGAVQAHGDPVKYFQEFFGQGPVDIPPAGVEDHRDFRPSDASGDFQKPLDKERFSAGEGDTQWAQGYQRVSDLEQLGVIELP
ncbi:hypothetical protein M878_44165 [Streptomyces roseochromogenus subsp. oscitans DS 12.976]|uniref:Uncharacterized protein n=1 Tax=Streptomyces roseochromogenus subsp. oscitans DS 12.976 TaxID=1352936 RepID=V6JPY2_STRRC|nr:hypothetical protein M878_44165 [Streptomyces roseochromogenus subsp. oscitans DS 12.976]